MLNPKNNIMLSFNYYNPTEVFFGKNAVESLGEISSLIGKKAMIVYGGGSVFRNGAYDDVTNQLKEYNVDWIEFSGIKSNPVIEDVKKAVSLGISQKVDFIIGIGGGSVIDSTKIISIAIAHKLEDSWQLMDKTVLPAKKIPVIAVPTLAATGTEMNHIAVIQNNKLGKKFGFKTRLNFPEHSFLDPSYTLSVPENYTAYGIVDLFSHVMENLVGGGNASLSDRFAVSILKEAVFYGPKLLSNPDDYELRAKIMWAATNALNGLTSYGKDTGDWGSHAIAHAISVLFDTPHGVTLSIVMPALFKYRIREIAEQLKYMGKEVFGVNTAEEALGEMKSFFSSLGVPVTLEEAGIDRKGSKEILNLINSNNVKGRSYDLSDEDRTLILYFMQAYD